jgi:glycosyltransferase involved in cell wall biosynthesis
MLIFVQPFGLNSSGGGPRIFRALLQNAPTSFMSICTSAPNPPSTSIGKELHLPRRPSFGRLERTRLEPYFYGIERLQANKFETQLTRICTTNNAVGIHGLAHTIDFWSAYQVAKKLELPFYLSVHDDLAYALKGRPEFKKGMACIGEAWLGAKARLVISEAMGQEYCSRYGKQPFTVVTDGLTQIPHTPLTRPDKSLRVYFMGAIHLSYEENFHSLLQALDLLLEQHPDWKISLTIRGNAPFSLVKSKIAVTFLPWASEHEVAKDLEYADLLYLPLPFGSSFSSFVKYSLSTKMVTYLGSGLPILYHGPENSAAGQLLSQNQAAVVADSLDAEVIQSVLTNAPKKLHQIVENALGIGRHQFALPDIRERFWQTLQHQGEFVCSP